MAELSLSTIRKRTNEESILNKKEQIINMTQKLAANPKEAIEIIYKNRKDIEVKRNRLLIPDYIEKIPLLISKKGKRFDTNMVREGFIWRKEILGFTQEKNNKVYDIPLELIIESREDYIKRSANLNKTEKKALLSWDEKKIASMNYRIHFKRDKQKTKTFSDTAFYFPNFEECLKMMNFIKGINILESGASNSHDNFRLVLWRLILGFRNQMIKKLRTAVNLRSEELRRERLRKQVKALKSSSLLAQLNQTAMKALASKWILEASKIDQKRKIDTLISSSLIAKLDGIAFKLLTQKWRTKSAEIRVLNDINQRRPSSDQNMLLSHPIRPQRSHEPDHMKFSLPMGKKDMDIQKKLKAKLNLKEHSIFIDMISELAYKTNMEIVLTDDEQPDKQDFLRLIDGEFVEVTFKDLSEKDLEKIKQDKNYRTEISNKAIEYLCKSNLYQINDQQKNVRVCLFKSNSHNQQVSAIITLDENCKGNEKSQHKSVPEVSISLAPDIPILCLNVDLFDSAGDKIWDLDYKESENRGGLDYCFPKGWKGYGLKVLDKYGPDNKWLTDRENGWAIGYHGVSNNTISIIQAILRTELKAGSRQYYEEDYDINPCKPEDREVGQGVYFAKIIEISEENYSEAIRISGKNYKFILQCRLNPIEIRIPSGEPNYYVVPDAKNIRPYRILVKEVDEQLF